jgi:hypothetical protein
LTDTPPSLASQLPQVSAPVTKPHSTQYSVGASLLAKAVYQPKQMLPDVPPSRASSLPQFFV